MVSAPGLAQTALELPQGAEPTLQDRAEQSSYEMPIGPFAEGRVPFARLAGAVRRQVWRIDETAMGSGALLAALSQQLSNAGFSEEFACAALTCGGFDFRFAIEVAPEPAMHVNMLSFDYAAFSRGPEEGITLLASEGGGAIYIQVIEVGPSGAAFEEVTISTRGGLPGAGFGEDTDLIADLRALSRAPLPGVVFEYGSTEFETVNLPALQELAAYLEENPSLEIVLVGHTDAEGGLTSNITVSRARAQTIRDILIDRYGIAPDRIDAQGVGYLMPLAPNSTQAGRDRNRRVEVVILNTD